MVQMRWFKIESSKLIKWKAVRINLLKPGSLRLQTPNATFFSNPKIKYVL